MNRANAQPGPQAGEPEPGRPRAPGRPPLRLIVLAGAAVAGFALYTAFITPGGGSPPARQALRLGVARQPSSALVILSLHEGYFADEGLDVAASQYVSGLRALKALLSGEVELTTSADVPIVLTSFDRSDLRILASVSSADNEARIVARSDRGVHSPLDLRGRRVGTQKGSAVHFFAYLFLLKNGMSERDVDLRFFEAEDLVPALVRGDIDAMAMREPFVHQARQALGGACVVFSEPGLYRRTEGLVCLQAFAAQRREAGERVIRALIRAEAFAQAHRRDAIRVLAAGLGTTEPAIEDLWQGLDLRVGLDQSLPLDMEEEARWAIRNGLALGPTIPNFGRLLDFASLEVVRSESVRVIH